MTRFARAMAGIRRAQSKFGDVSLGEAEVHVRAGRFVCRGDGAAMLRGHTESHLRLVRASSLVSAADQHNVQLMVRGLAECARLIRTEQQPGVGAWIATARVYMRRLENAELKARALQLFDAIDKMDTQAQFALACELPTTRKPRRAGGRS